MIVKEIHILPTTQSPEVLLNPKGFIKIKGRWMKVDVADFSKPIWDWLDEYICDHAEITRVDICLEYYNDANSARLITLLRKILYVKLKDKKLIINWYYEDGDEDISELGEYISSALEIPFNFIMTPDFVSC